MSNRDSIVFLEDIKEAIERIERGVQGQSYEDFLSDEKGMYSAFMNLAIIGEASKNLPDEVKELTDAVPWKKIAAMRNKLIHEYWGYDTETVWATIIISLPELKVEIVNLLKKLEPGTSSRES